MSSPATQSGQGVLRKELNLLLLIFMMIGLNMGGSLFTLTSSAAGLAGPALVVAQLIAALPVLLAIVPYMIITSIAPKSAASYQYAKLFNYPLATSAVMVLLVAIPLGGLPLFALSAGKYILLMMPGVPEMVGGLPIYWDSLIAIIIITIFYIINIVGIKPAGIAQFIMTAIMLLALVVFVVLGFPAVKMANFTPFFTGSTINFMAAAALSYTLLAGGLFGIELGDEVRKAHSTIPKAIVISLISVLVLYIFIEFVALGAVSWQTFAKGNLGAVAHTFMPEGMWVFFLIGGGVLACITSVHAILAISGRYTMVYAQDGFFPPILKRINKTFGTPVWGLTLPYVLCVIMLLFVRDITIFGAMLNFGLLYMVTLVLLTAYRLPKAHPEMFAQSKLKIKPAILSATAIAACVLNILFMLLLILIIFMQHMDWAFWLFVIAIAVGVLLYYIRKKQGAIKAVDISEYK